MHSIRPRPICRAHNTFSPSVALWQYFVAPNGRPSQRQLSSAIAIKTPHSRDDETANANDDSLASDVTPASEKTLVFKKVRTEKGNYEINKALYPKYGAKSGLSRQKSKGAGARIKQAHDAEALLRKAYEAYDSAQDYEGVNVLPIEHGRPIKESTFPWVSKDWAKIESAEERSVKTSAQQTVHILMVYR